MTTPSESADPESSRAQRSREETTRGGGQLLVDLGPVIVFVVSFNVLQRIWKDDEALKATAIFWATGLFMVATIAAISYVWLKTRRVPPVLWVMGALVLIFGGLTIFLQNSEFLRIKPICLYLFYAIAIFIAHILRFNLWKMLFGHAFSLPERIWRILALRWGAFFVFMAALSVYFWLSVDVWETMTESFWVQTRLWVTFPLVFLFAIANIPLTMKHIGGDAKETPAPTDI